MPRLKAVSFDHDRELSAMATWWKAVFLTPIWAFLFILPFGPFMRQFPAIWDTVGFCLVIIFGGIYFCRDLFRRAVLIDDNKIYFGMGCHSLSNLKRIKLGYAMSVVPSRLVLEFAEDQKESIAKAEIVLFMASMTWQDMEGLISLLSRKVSHLKVDDEVERVLRARKPLVVAHIQDPEHLEVKYHAMPLVEELPAVLEHTVYEWSRVVGPIGTVILASPLWLYFNFVMYNALRDYANVSANQEFYNQLIKLITYFGESAGAGLSLFERVFYYVNSPLSATLLFCVFTYFLYKFFSSSFLSPNKLTVNSEGISLDKWSYLWSINAKSVQWKDVEHVALNARQGTADPGKWSIVFSSKKGELLRVPLSAVSAQDRTQLASAIERFAGSSTVEAQLTESLRPSQDKSYTELWLQSLTSTSRINLDPLETGHQLYQGRYEVVSTLAVGGEGVAYLAQDLKEINSGIVSDVVLKETLIPPFIDKEIQQESVERFEREARLLKELESEHIVGMRDYFIEDKRCYLVLEYIKGMSLRHFVAEKGAFTAAETLDLAQQMTAILTFLHSKQIIHRDFTPDNLIRKEDGKLKLIDFNVARQWDKDDGKTGTIVGKHAYVPPEQFRGKACEASDIYALGATLFYLATGSDPEPISQSSLQDLSSNELEQLSDLIKSCTSLNLKGRIKDAFELQCALTGEKVNG